MSTTRLLAIAIALLPAASHAVVIDDFTAGPITVATSGERFDEVTATQDGLATEQVLFGGRHFDVQQRDDAVSLQVDTSDSGRFIYHTDGRSGINTFVRYTSEAGVNLIADDENALVFSFTEAQFEHQGRTVGFIDLRVNSTNGAAYQYVRTPSSSEPFRLAIPFSLLGSVDPHDVTALQFGTGNGNLDGEFTLESITSERLAPGDYNGDGAVNAADYSLWRDATRPNAFYIYHGDGNHDGVVDVADYAVWQTAYASGNAPAVPEPHSALTLLAATAIATLARRSTT